MSKVAKIGRHRNLEESSLNSTFDALSSHVAILDRSGTIVSVNLAWRHFADSNGLRLSNYGIGINYFAVCDAASGTDSKEAREAAKGIREVLTGQRDSFYLEYACHNLMNRRWFQLRATRLDGDELARVAVVHENITEAKKAQEALKTSEERLRLLLETSNAIPWEADVESCEFSYVGPQAERLLGYPLRRWYEKNFWSEHIHQDDRQIAIQTCHQLSRTHKDFQFEYRMVSSAGKTLWVHDIVSVETVAGAPKTLRGFLIDITEQKQRDEKLKEHHSFLRQVIDIDPNFIFAKDRQGRFTLVNQAVADAYGTTVENLVGKTDSDFNSNAAEVEFFRNMDLSVMNTLQEKFIPEEQITDAQGMTRWLQTVKRPIIGADGQAHQVLGASSDVSARKRAEEALRETEERTRLIVESALDAVVSMDTQGLITGWNPQAENIFGWRRDQVMGRRLDETVMPDRYRKAHDRGLKQFLKTETGPLLNRRSELTAIHRDGHEFPVELTVVPTRTAKTVSFNAFVRDITERKQAEAELEERLRFEQLVANISANLVNVSAKDVDAAIEESLRLLGEFFDADRCALIEFVEDSNDIRSSYRWHSHRVVSSERLSTPILSATLGEAWKRGETVVFDGLNDIPKEQKALRDAVMRAGFKSHMSVPLQVAGQCIGALGITTILEERHWSPRLVQRIKTFGEIFANAMTRKRADETLQRLSGRLIHAQEESRRELARELHDDVTQRLAVIAIEAGKLEQQSDFPPEFIHGKLQGMKDQIVRLAGDIHRISRQLHPSILDDLGLVEAMESECQRFSDTEGIPVRFSADRFPGGAPKDLALCLYRVTQEALRNISKHSKTKEARVTLRRVKGEVIVKIADRGVGFDPGSTRGKIGLGLASMEERVRLIQGKFSIHSTRGKGTTVEIKVPFTRNKNSRKPFLPSARA